MKLTLLDHITFWLNNKIKNDIVRYLVSRTLAIIGSILLVCLLFGFVWGMIWIGRYFDPSMSSPPTEQMIYAIVTMAIAIIIPLFGMIKKW